MNKKIFWPTLALTLSMIISLAFLPLAWAANSETEEEVGGPGVTVGFAFAPQEGVVALPEQPYREEVCLNGLWDFQPQSLPSGYQAGDNPPALDHPSDNGWSSTPIKIPSPWNVNGFNKSDGGDYRAFPSYPEAWESAQMGWLRRKFKAPDDWRGHRVFLHFEGVAGFCQIYVNGKPITHNFELFLPFEADITDEIRWGEENELRVGVRKASLFELSGDYTPSHMYLRQPTMVRAVPGGSFWGPQAVGIWQDVYLLKRPQVYLENVFVKPLVDQDLLAVEATVVNRGSENISITLQGEIAPWINTASGGLVGDVEPSWKLGSAVLGLSDQVVEVPAGGQVTTTFSTPVGGNLLLWWPEDPRLYGLVLRAMRSGEIADRKYQRFGWRQFKIVGNGLYLNGQYKQLKGDSWHFMGIPQMSRRYAHAWYTMIKEANGNAVRLHAQPFPSYYLDVADEMGMMVLDETAIWGTCMCYKFEHSYTIDRFQEHLRKLVLRDRNHPSVFGWSMANEVTGPLGFYSATDEEEARIFDIFAGLRDMVRSLDDTRDWISNDGDADLDGRLPVTGLHYYGKEEYEAMAAKGKPLMVGEATIAYFGTPPEVSRFNGYRAYESVLGRMEGIAIEAYDSLVRAQLPLTAYASVFNLVWYGLKPLPLGLSDTGRVPALKDGIFFPAYREGVPGIQPERLGPYSSTLNPGFDPSLPLYQPWPLFDAVKAAFHPDGPQASTWDQPFWTKPERDPLPVPPVNSVAFLGDHEGPIWATLTQLGVQVLTPQAGQSPPLLILDCAALNDSDLKLGYGIMSGTLAAGGDVMVWVSGHDGLTQANQLLPLELKLTNRENFSLLPATQDHPLINGYTLADLYFVDYPSEAGVMHVGLTGPIVGAGKALLRAADVNWRHWNGVGEEKKTASVYRTEMERKEEGYSLVEYFHGGGRILICNFLLKPESSEYRQFFARLLYNIDQD